MINRNGHFPLGRGRELRGRRWPGRDRLQAQVAVLFVNVPHARGAWPIKIF